MVDVAAKPATHRVAIASGRIEMLPATLSLIEASDAVALLGTFSPIFATFFPSLIQKITAFG